MRVWNGDGLNFSLLEASLSFLVTKGHTLLPPVHSTEDRIPASSLLPQPQMCAPAQISPNSNEAENRTHTHIREQEGECRIEDAEFTDGHTSVAEVSLGAVTRYGTESRGEGSRVSASTEGVVMPELKPTDDAGAILVFLTGWEEISAMRDRMLQHPVLGDGGRVQVLMCHGQMPVEEQVGGLVVT